jgi:hypothetical protein
MASNNGHDPSTAALTTSQGRQVSVTDPKEQCQEVAKLFFDSLTADEQHLYTATTQSSQLLDDVKALEQEDAKKGKVRRLSSKIEPFIAGVEGYASAMDAISNAQSAFLSPIWGSVRIVIHVSLTMICENFIIHADGGQI